MKPLTPEQSTAILAQIKNPGIRKINIEVFDNGLTHVTIISKVDAEFNLVDISINELCEVMNLEYRGEPCNYQDDKTDVDLYTVNWDGETLISLSMVREPEPVVWGCGICHATGGIT